MSSNVNEGSVISLRGSVNIPQHFSGVTQQISPGTTIYWRAIGEGVTGSDFSSGLATGSFQIQNDGTFNDNININADLSDEGTEYVLIYLYTDQLFSTDWNLGHARFLISDTSLNPFLPQTIYGNSGSDDLSGREGSDRIYGYAGNDTIRGLGGNDRTYGGYGDDQLYGDDGDDELYGEQDDDYLYGGNGNDRLSGGDGVDYLDGGNGDDIYVIEDERDTINDSGGSSDVDKVILKYWSGGFVLRSDIEDLAVDGISITEITGNSSRNTILAGSGSSIVNGGEGNDVLVGQAGLDRLSGGAGADVFKYESINDSTSRTRDIITDFQSSRGDKISLREIDANVLVDGDQAFRFSSKNKFSKKSAGELIFSKGVARVDIDGDRQADMEILISGIKKANASFFDL